MRLDILEERAEAGKDLLELSRNLIALFEEYINLKRVRLPGIMTRLKPSQLADASDIIISIINIPLKIKQSLLEELNTYARGVRVYNILKKEVLQLRSQRDIEPKLKREEGQETDYEEYKKKIAAAQLPEYVKIRADEELERLAAMPPFSAEGTVSRYYLDWLLAIPWKKFKKENKDIRRAAQILDEDHYGLRKVKERILDYLAVRLLVKKAEGEILCFVGPPGVGKSSLSKSIARALDRKFVRVSLGGVKDEAEIRGHRRTYIGSYPGQIVKGLKKAGSMNPVFLLDEIDKLNSDFRGDPASALLEALDPEQNAEFTDHYLDLELDLSQVFFITTANFADNIPPALLDRMEVIELPGYTEREKLQIAKNFLLKKQAEKNGFSADEIQHRRRRAAERHQRVHPRSRRAQPGARDRGHHAQDRPRHHRGRQEEQGKGKRRSSTAPGCRNTWASPSTATRRYSSATRSAWPSAWPGPRPAATSWWSKPAC